MENLYLIVGLGNPDKVYEHTRHNVGFDYIDKFADSLGLEINQKAFKSLYVKCKYFDKTLILLKPQTYMNNSGIAVAEVVNYFKIDINNVLIVHDDMDFEPGVIKIKESGSSAGHNGIKSIIENLKTENFKRIRIGVGKFKYDIVDYVLSKPSKEEQILIDEAETKAVEATKVYLKESFNKAMSLYNTHGNK